MQSGRLYYLHMLFNTHYCNHPFLPLASSQRRHHGKRWKDNQHSARTKCLSDMHLTKGRSINVGRMIRQLAPPVALKWQRRREQCPLKSQSISQFLSQLQYRLYTGTQYLAVAVPLYTRQSKLHVVHGPGYLYLSCRYGYIHFLLVLRETGWSVPFSASQVTDDNTLVH